MWDIFKNARRVKELEDTNNRLQEKLDVATSALEASHDSCNGLKFELGAANLTQSSLRYQMESLREQLGGELEAAKNEIASVMDANSVLSAIAATRLEKINEVKKAIDSFEVPPCYIRSNKALRIEISRLTRTIEEIRELL